MSNSDVVPRSGFPGILDYGFFVRNALPAVSIGIYTRSVISKADLAVIKTNYTI